MKNILFQSLWLIPLFFLVGCNGFPFLTPAQNTLKTTTPQSPLLITPGSIVQATLPAQPSLASPDATNLPRITNMDIGWNQIDPGGNTTCARGGKYSFFVRKASSNKLLIYFEGGGSCYDARTCRQGANYFDDSIDPTFEADNPALKSYGVFDMNNTLNPFLDYNIVFVSYCTGDAFLGNRTVQYTDDKGTFQVKHMGFVNTQAVFEWTYQNFPKPDSVYIIGCSAGVVGSYFNAPYLLQHYQNTPFALVGDFGGGYLDGSASMIQSFGTLDLFPNWLPQYQNAISGQLFQTKFVFTIPAQAYPNARFGLLDTQNDSTQSEIISRFDPKLTLYDVLKSNIAELRADVANIYSYSGPGDSHCITMQPAYYNFVAGGIKLNDWMSSFTAVEPPTNVGP